MKRTVVCSITALLLLSTVALASPGDCGKQCQGNPEMGKGMGAGMGPGMGHKMGMRGPGMKMRGGGDGIGRLMMMSEELQLTDQQKEKIHSLVSAFQLEQIDRRAAIQKARLKMGELRRNDKASESEIFASIDEMAKLRTDMAKAQYRHHQAVRNVLTDKQKEQLKTMRFDRMHRMWDDDEEDDVDDAPQAPRGPRGDGN